MREHHGECFGELARTTSRRNLENAVTRGDVGTNKWVPPTTKGGSPQLDSMPTNPPNAELGAEPLECAARISAAIEDNYELLLRSVAVLVAKTERGRHWPEVTEIAAEVLQAAVEEALKHAQSFDPSRSATAWVRGIAARLLMGRRRKEARAWRCVPATVLGDDAWSAALGQLCTGSADAAVAERIDLAQALGRLSPEGRRAIELRYYQGLDGDELASALGVATPGAARVRVCRALQALRTHFPPAEIELIP
jgi:RNA polymerase sigma factor (sigma-70 family)